MTATQEIAQFRDGSDYIRGRQHGFRKDTPDAQSFASLPREIVEEIGLRTHVGVRIELAVLSRMAREAQRNADGDQTVGYTTGEVAEAGDGVFILSIQTVAEDLFWRWFQQSSEAPSFAAFYERVKAGVRRLKKKGYLERLGFVAGDSPALGTWWHVPIDLNKCHPLPSAPFVLRSSVPAAKDLPEGQINATDLIGSIFAAEKCDAHTLSEISVSLRTGRADRHRYHDFQDWHSAIAESPVSGEAHASVGASTVPYVKRSTQSYYVPWVVLDFDRDDPLDAIHAARCASEEIVEAGVPDTHFCVCPTGGTGIHIQIPMGLFGNPVFSSRANAKKGLKELSRQLTTEEVDEGLFDPRHLYRLVGSRHVSEGQDGDVQLGGWKTCFSARDFMKAPAAEVLEATREPTPVEMWPDPREVETRPDLVMLMMEAAIEAQRFYVPPRDETPALEDLKRSSGVLERAMQGVAEGETWWNRGDKYHQGRNKQMFVIACSLFGRGESEEGVRRQMDIANQRNEPRPLPDHEVQNCLVSAKRTAN